ncbi:MAG: NUDIX domain-containing protein [Anaerolineae bacterium]|nr:NUDIX domain-containing protein [Anaerolineae bacterium]
MPTPAYILRLRQKIGHDLIMMPVAGALMSNEAGEILLQQRSDNGQWTIPGGAIEPGEEPGEAIIREVREETGLDVIPERLVGVYGGEAHIAQYPNGDQVAMIALIFACRIVGGTLQTDDDETLDLQYFAPDALPLNFPERYHKIIEDFLTRTEPFFHTPE